MLRVSLQVWPYGRSEARREIAAVAIGRVEDLHDGRNRYVALTSGDGMFEPPRAATVAHAPEDGCLALLRAALLAATEDGVQQLVGEHRSILQQATELERVDCRDNPTGGETQFAGGADAACDDRQELNRMRAALQSLLRQTKGYVELETQRGFEGSARAWRHAWSTARDGLGEAVDSADMP